MKKITDIYEDRKLTREERDNTGHINMVRKSLRYKRQVKLATPEKRFAGFFIDMVFLALVFTIISLPAHSEGIFYLWVPIYIIYYVTSELLFRQTPGKMLTRTYLVNDYLKAPSIKQVLLRTLIRFILWDPFTFFWGHRGWHDQWTHTWVLPYEEVRTLVALMKDENNFDIENQNA